MNIEMVLIVILGLLSGGTLLVVFGTIAKNRWGINLDPVSCPRCGTPFPRNRSPQNAREALWGGGTCARCGTEVDKWGRELGRQERGQLVDGGVSAGEVRRLVRRRLAVYPPAAFFGLALLFGWLGIGSDPSTLSEWMAFGVSAAVETAIFSVLFYAAATYVLNRFFLKEDRHSARQQGHE